MAGIVDFERDLLLQRTNEGRARAMAEGTRFGRTIALSYYVDHSTISRLKARHAAGGQVARLSIRSRRSKDKPGQHIAG